jgi:rhamnosyltransferase
MGNTILFNKALKAKILPFPEMVEFHDYWIALINELFGHRITMPEALVRYRIHADNASNTKTGVANHRFSPYRYSEFIHGQIVPPFLHSCRAGVIRHIMDRYQIDEEERKVMVDFLSYLEGRGSRVRHIETLLTHSLLKRDWIYRLGVTLNYLWHGRDAIVKDRCR